MRAGRLRCTGRKHAGTTSLIGGRGTADTKPNRLFCSRLKPEKKTPEFLVGAALCPLSGEMFRHQHLHRPLLCLVNRFSWHVFVPGFRFGDNSGESPRYPQFDALPTEAGTI